MDELDRSIVIELQRDARKSDAQMARTLHVSGASIRRRIRKMVDDSVLRVVAVPDPQKVGYDTSAMIGVQVQPSKIEEVASRLVKEPRVHSVFLSTGPFDLLIWVTFRSQQELADFMKFTLYAMNGVARSETMLLLREVKVSQRILDDPDGRPDQSYLAREKQDSSGRAGVEQKPAEIDDCDYNLILELQKDARQNDADLGRKLSMSDATVRRRVTRLLKEGIIKVGPIINPAKLGYLVTLNIGLQMDLSKIDHAIDVLLSMPRVHYIALTTGRYDILLWATFRSQRELSDFLRLELAKVPGMARNETLVQLEIRKRERAVLQPNRTIPTSEKAVRPLGRSTKPYSTRKTSMSQP